MREIVVLKWESHTSIDQNQRVTYTAHGITLVNRGNVTAEITPLWTLKPNESMTMSDKYPVLVCISENIKFLPNTIQAGETEVIQKIEVSFLKSAEYSEVKGA